MPTQLAKYKHNKENKMLKLNRRANESFFIGDDLVTVMEITNEDILLSTSTDGVIEFMEIKVKDKVRLKDEIFLCYIRPMNQYNTFISIGIDAPRDINIAREEIL